MIWIFIVLRFDLVFLPRTLNFDYCVCIVARLSLSYNHVLCTCVYIMGVCMQNVTRDIKSVLQAITCIQTFGAVRFLCSTFFNLIVNQEHRDRVTSEYKPIHTLPLYAARCVVINLIKVSEQT